MNDEQMSYIDVMKYCLSFPNAARKPLTASGTVFALVVGESAFGYFETGAPIQWQFSLRVPAEQFDSLPNPPMVRQASDKPDDNWITIERVENFNSNSLRELISWSYQKALTS